MKYKPDCRWWLIAPFILALSCKSGEKLYNKGRYDEAVIAFVKKLRKSPTSSTSLTLLPQAYAQSVQLHEKNATAALSSSGHLKFESALQEYQVLQNLYNNIEACPACLTVVTPKDYRNAINASKDTAAATRYDRGMALLRNGDKFSARKAYSNFQAALSLVPDYKNAKEMMDQAYQMGMAIVEVRDVALVSQYDQRALEPVAAVFRDNVLNNLRAKNNNNFVQILPESEVVKNKLHADYLVDIRVEDFLVSKPNIQKNFRELVKTVEIVEPADTTKRPRQSEKIRKETYKGVLYFTNVTVVTGGNIVCYLIDGANDDDMEKIVLPADAGWSNAFCYFKGDERVLAPEDRKLIGGQDLPSPTVGELFQAAVAKSYGEITNVVMKHYSNF
ncbi:tetratricopeptide repeat protein [Chitinophaga silvisoli]|uniref:Tetratricopeptide repeat protein n=1 Tax=Chitinophaga silvisoli TaxID=2291814 RepID=A0A3E1NZ42_9BACT|nr:hypothetical protein [Chitinophaga silvisoli]RFM33211.1 hypothetical protein DXN04_19465 [Chitinophaga silvisoli]